MNTSVTRPEVLAFVAAVRRELDDLNPDEIDELTGGLEADLDDAFADATLDPPGGAGELFGPPVEYAAELRSAAGLPPRPEAGGRRGAAGVRAWARGVRDRRWVWLERRPWWPAVRDFLLVLRPAWWFVRAALLAVLLFNSSGALARVLAFGVLLVISVQAGRRSWARRNRRLRTVVLLANAIALVFLPSALARVSTPDVGYGVDSVPPQDGLWLDGTEVRNVIPYDGAGNPLTDVQLFDENGRPLAVGSSAREPLWRDGYPGDGGAAQIPGVTEGGAQAWNVYPLRQIEVRDGEPSVGANPQPVGSPSYPSVPGLRVPRLLSPRPSASASASASPSVSPSASPAPTASP